MNRQIFVVSGLSLCLLACGGEGAESGESEPLGGLPDASDTSPVDAETTPREDTSTDTEQSQSDTLTTPRADSSSPLPRDSAGPMEDSGAEIPDTARPEDGTSALDTARPEDGTSAVDTGGSLTDSGAVMPDTSGADTGSPPACECDDENPCTFDACDPETGDCAHTPVPLTCEDGDPCTVGDLCEDGACVSGALTPPCDDGNPCTSGSCEAGLGCVFDPTNTGQSCDDGNSCTSGELCTAGVCSGGALPNCDDADPCTEDSCKNEIGCVHVVSQALCDDGKPCTVDTCDSELGCAHVELVDGTACVDAEPCLIGDQCLSGVCVSGSEPLSCDDEEACTLDACVPGVGCSHDVMGDGTSCDDGQEETANDVCKAGTCKGVAGACAQLLSLNDPTLKMTSLSVSSSTDNAFDIDGDGLPDNALAPIAGFVNAPVSTAIDDGTLRYLAHLAGFSPDTVFSVHFFLGELDPSNATCSVQTDVCDYLVASEGFDELCAPISSFPAVTWDGDALQSVETGLFELAFTFNGTVYSITVHDAVIDVPVQLSGSTMTSSAGGRVGGALVKQDLLDLVGLIDTGSVNVPLLLNALVEPDIDADQDGVFESISVLLELTGIGGNIVGVYP